MPAVAEATVAVVMATTAEVTNVTVATDRPAYAAGDEIDEDSEFDDEMDGGQVNLCAALHMHGGTAGPCSIQRQRGLRLHHQ